MVTERAKIFFSGNLWINTEEQLIVLKRTIIHINLKNDFSRNELNNLFHQKTIQIQIQTK